MVQSSMQGRRRPAGSRQPRRGGLAAAGGRRRPMARWQRRLSQVTGGLMGGLLGGRCCCSPIPHVAGGGGAGAGAPPDFPPAPTKPTDGADDGRWSWAAGVSGPGPEPERVVAAVREAARRHGLGIAVQLTVQDYHARVPTELECLPTHGRARTLAVLLGSTREIWPPLLAELAAEPALIDDDAHEGPLNAFVVRAAEAIVAECVPAGVACQLFYAHEMAPGRLVAVQHAAHAAGAAYFHPSIGLCVHPEYGPWHSYRALLVLDMEGAAPGAIDPPSDPCAGTTEVADAEEALRLALAATADPLATNSQLELEGNQRETWRLWQRVRSSVTVGAEWQYEDAHDEYHYCWNRDILRRMIAQQR
jgi:hypothetical protein